MTTVETERPPNPIDCWFCPTGKAIRAFSRERYAALARTVRHRLQRIRASGIYDDNLAHKTLWDEFCHEVQEGPIDLLGPAWDATVDPFLKAAVDAISPEEAALLTIAAAWDLDRDGVADGSVCRDLIQVKLEQAFRELAGERDMSGFGAW